MSSDQESVPLAETRHRVANVFQLLSTLGRLRAQRASDPETKRQLTWMLDAIGALGVLQHRLLSPNGEDFAGFIQDMAPHWRRRAANRPITIETVTEPAPVSEQIAAALTLIAQELVANAVSHAFPDGRAGEVRVELKRLDERRAVLVVADDGVGYALEAADKSRLGLWLIGGLADQVKGVLTITREAGVAARLEFPTI
jgi:two-component sensor histidine kinase